MKSLPPLNALKAFEAAARHGNLSHAAKELGVSHSAVSRHVKVLEDWFKKDLVTRHETGIALTEAGPALASATTQGLGLITDAVEKLTATADPGRLTLQLEPAFGGKWMRRRLGQMSRALGGVNIEMWSDQLHPDHFPRNADVQVHFMPDCDWPDVETFPIVELFGFVAASPRLLRREGMPASPQDVARFTLLHGEDRGFWETWLREHDVEGVSANAGLLFGDYTLTVEAAVDGEGLLIADPVLCECELDDGTPRAGLRDSFYCMTYYVSCLKSQLQRALVRKARAWIMQEVSATANKSRRPSRPGLSAQPKPDDPRRLQQANRSVRRKRCLAGENGGVKLVHGSGRRPALKLQHCRPVL